MQLLDNVIHVLIFRSQQNHFLAHFSALPHFPRRQKMNYGSVNRAGARAPQNYSL